jgi:hypothetical protein
MQEDKLVSLLALCSISLTYTPLDFARLLNYLHFLPIRRGIYNTYIARPWSIPNTENYAAPIAIGSSAFCPRRVDLFCSLPGKGELL